MSELSAHCHKAFERCLGAKQAGIIRIETSLLSLWWGLPWELGECDNQATLGLEQEKDQD